MKERLQAILYTMNHIEVHGKSNLDRMLGCIQEVEEMLRNVQQQETEGGSEDGAV